MIHGGGNIWMTIPFCGKHIWSNNTL